jgi:hypothetical protein
LGVAFVSITEGAEAERVTMSNSWAALRMIRETIETLGPPGILPAEGVNGPEPVHEAEAIVEALRKLLTRDG